VNSPALRAVSVSPLIDQARAYLPVEDCERLKTAYRFSDEAHLGQFRQSGEPYVSHPLAVAEICTQWRLDSEALMAALLHDTVEDTKATGLGRRLIETRCGRVSESGRSPGRKLSKNVIGNGPGCPCHSDQDR